MGKKIPPALIYISHIWHGRDGKPSLPKIIAIALTIHFMFMFSRAVYAWEVERSMEGLSGALAIEAGLIAGCLGIRAYTAAQDTRERETTKRAAQQGRKPLDEDQRPDIEPGPQE